MNEPGSQETSANSEQGFIKVPELAMRNLVNTYHGARKDNISESRSMSLTERSGQDYGRLTVLEGLLEKLGQGRLIHDFENAFVVAKGWDTSEVKLDPVSGFTHSDKNALLLDYKHLYLLHLKNANPEPKPSATKLSEGLRKWYLKEVLGGDPILYKKGIIEGKLGELRAFLTWMGYRIDMDQIQQNAERSYRRDPQIVQSMLQDREKWRGGVLKIDEKIKGDWLVKLFKLE